MSLSSVLPTTSSVSGMNAQLKGVDEHALVEVEDFLQNVEEVKCNFEVMEKVGSGTFSSVFVAKPRDCPSEERLALKCIVPSSMPTRIDRELQCLTDIGGQDNVMGIEGCIRDKEIVVMVMPYFEHDRFQDYIESLSANEVRQYMWNLLVALRRVHQFNYIHRDVKPSNFLVNRKLEQYALIDFGLAQKVLHNRSSQRLVHRGAVKAGGRRGGRLTGAGRKTLARAAGQPGNRRVADSANTQHPLPHRVLLEHNSANQLPADSVAVDKRPRCVSRNEAMVDLARKASVAAAVTRCSERCEESNEQSALLAGKHSKNTDGRFHACERKDRSAARVGRPSAHDATRKENKAEGRAGEQSTAGVATRGRHTAGRCNASRRKVANVSISKDGKYMYRNRLVTHAACLCLENLQVCTLCQLRPMQEASRAGTPGFRPPEVLMKCPHQTTAVDIWAAGVIFLSLLSHRYPFFKASDDLAALAQIVSIFGTEAVNTSAKTYGKTLASVPVCATQNLRELCGALHGVSGENGAVGEVGDAAAYDLLSHMLHLNPQRRITAAQALNHPYFTDHGLRYTSASITADSKQAVLPLL